MVVFKDYSRIKDRSQIKSISHIVKIPVGEFGQTERRSGSHWRFANRAIELNAFQFSEIH